MEAIQGMTTNIIVFIVVMFLIIIICLIWYYRRSDKKANQKDTKIKEKMIKYNSIFTTEINHICGLPLAEETRCFLNLCHEEIIIESTGKVFKLNKKNIIDMNIKTSKEVQNSISGAVGGAILLGPIGAFLYGTTTDFHRFYIIIYKNKESKEQCISFDMKDDIKVFKEVSKYIEEFKNNIIDDKEIEL